MNALSKTGIFCSLPTQIATDGRRGAERTSMSPAREMHPVLLDPGPKVPGIGRFAPMKIPCRRLWAISHGRCRRDRKEMPRID